LTMKSGRFPYNPTKEQMKRYDEKRHVCLVRWVAKELPKLGKARTAAFFRNIAKKSSPEYANTLREEARTIWLMTRRGA
jgi:hypothetical protein